MSGSAEVVPQLVAGKYRLTQLLGRGGMGSVWEGIHTSLGTRVAVKFIESEYADSREARNRFENEARAAATLRSKHVVQVFDHGVMDDARPYIVMEFLAGEPLDRRLDRVGRLSPTETARIVLQVCRALAKAHEAGIVHRDLKPENVFLVWDDEDGADIVKVVDFGIAKFSNANIGMSSATRTGSVLGTPYYMSPEQARGLRSVDYRSDLWSVGVIAFRCVVGHLPFDGEAVGDLLVKICTSPLPVPSQHAPVPPGFDAWFTRALQREPAERFGSAMEMAEALCATCGVSLRGRMASTTGDQPAHVSAGAAVGTPTPGSVAAAPATHSAAAITAGVMTQTPAPATSGSKAGIIAAVIAAVIVLGIGVAVAIKQAGSDEVVAPVVDDVPAKAAAPPAPDPPKSEPAPLPPPTIEPAPAAPSPPAASVAVTPQVKKPAPRPAAKPAKSDPKPKPTSTPRPSSIDVGY
jgi:serine/threonine-protein kinase